MNYKRPLIIIFWIFAYLETCYGIRLQNFKISKITTSGISSGSAMAAQLHVAHSSIIQGSGNIAGPPYYCAFNSLLTAGTSCMSNTITIGINMLSIYNKVSSYKSQNLIDDPENLRNHYVYIFSGLSDFIVSTNVVKKSEEFFKNYMDSYRIKSVYNVNSGHGIITDFYGSSCLITNSYFINNCNYNQAYDILDTLHPEGNLKIPTKGANLLGKFIEFDQTEFFPAGITSMDSTGYIYVPPQCETSTCKLHIAFHGCLQGKTKIGDVYIKNSGYNQVADLNDFIIVYPQVVVSLAASNPNGCWDWWGYTDSNFATKEGTQIKAIKAMIDRIAFNK